MLGALEGGDELCLGDHPVLVLQTALNIGRCGFSKPSLHQRAFIADIESGFLVHFIHEADRQLPGGGAAGPALGGDKVVKVLHYRPHLTKRDQAILVGVKDSENRVPTIDT